MSGSIDPLARFVLELKHQHVSPQGRRRIVDALTDVTACALAGAREPVAVPLLKVFGTSTRASGNMQVSVLGLPLFASESDAATLNGAFGHVLDYDDISHPAYTHPSVSLMPTLFALAASSGASGRELVTAYAAGLQVIGKLGRALNLTHIETGWHPTCTFGSIGAAVAAARLLRLDAEKIMAATSIAASSAAGLRLNFGTMTKPLHAGYAARNGLLAARLAQHGLGAAPDPLTHRYGFVNVFGARGPINWPVFDSWTDLLEIDSDYGLSLKPYPACAATHTPIEAALAVRARLNGDIGRIRSMRVGACRVSFTALLYDNPQTELEAKFSMQYSVAAALVHGDINLASFAADNLFDARVRALMPRIAMVDDERVREHSELGTTMQVTLDDGSSFEEIVMIAAGKPERWFNTTQMRAKFEDCTRHVGSPAWRDQAFASLQALDSDEPAATLLAALQTG